MIPIRALTLARRIRHGAWRAYHAVRSARLYPEVAPDPTASFDVARDEALGVFERLSAVERAAGMTELVDRYSSPHWKRERPAVRELVLGGLSPSFRRSRVLGRHILTVSPGARHIREYVRVLSQPDASLAGPLSTTTLESGVGRPYLEYRIHRRPFSANTVEHLYYVERILRGTDGGRPEAVVELGGGFGNLARVIRLLSPRATYVDVDYPEVLAIAHLSLRMNFPDARIVVHADGDPQIVPEAINLVPMWQVDTLRFRTDLFVSTLALSETSDAMRDVCASSGYFDCRRLYLLGSDDREFRSARHLQEAVVARFGADCIKPALKPRCYEVIASAGAAAAVRAR